MASSLQDWEKWSDNLHQCDSRGKRGMKEWTNMARLNLWCEQADDRKQLINPTASIQIWSIHPLFTFILSLSPVIFGSSLLLGVKASSPLQLSPAQEEKKVAVLSAGGFLYEVPLSALRASCSLCRYVSYRRIRASRCSSSSLSRNRRKLRSSGMVNASHWKK